MPADGIMLRAVGEGRRADAIDTGPHETFVTTFACFCFYGSGGTQRSVDKYLAYKTVDSVSKTVHLTANVCFCQCPVRTQFRP